MILSNDTTTSTVATKCKAKIPYNLYIKCKHSSNTQPSSDLKAIKTEHNYCYLNKEERIVEIKKLLKEEIDKLAQQQQQTHSSRYSNSYSSRRYQDCDTSLIDMDISPERKPVTRNLRATIKNAIKLKNSLVKFKPKSNKCLIFVGNVSKNYTKNDIKRLFSRFGQILTVNLYGKRYRYILNNFYLTFYLIFAYLQIQLCNYKVL